MVGSALRFFKQTLRAKAHVLILLFVLAFGLGVRVRNIEAVSPYCGHVDEKTWMEIAWRMMRDGDLNPHRFTKPSLPVYVMTLGSSLGLFSAAANGEVTAAKDLGEKVYPFYTVPRAALVPKQIFALFSVLALGLLGVVARLLTGRDAALWLSPLLGSLSAFYLDLSWSYMNVDILGAFFVWATVTQLLLWVRRRRRNGGVESNADVLIAGVLAGATIGCKYNLFLILLPCLLTVAMGPRERVVARCALLLSASAAVFILTTPYALLDYGTFLSHAAREVRHYATGHRDTVIGAGFPMFAHYSAALVADFGPVLTAFSLWGLWLVARRDLRLFLVTFSFPVAFLWYMSDQSAFFLRNLVALPLFMALGTSVTLLELPKLFSALWRLLPRWEQSAKKVRWATVLSILAVVMASLPWGSLSAAYRSDVSSRRSAEHWALAHLEKGTRLLVDDQLRMDTRRLRDKFEVSSFSSNKQIERGKAGQRLRKKHRRSVAIVPEGEQPFFKQLKKGGKKLASFGTEPVRPPHAATQNDPALVLWRLR